MWAVPKYLNTRALGDVRSWHFAEKGGEVQLFALLDVAF